jgi:hypothetical protein
MTRVKTFTVEAGRKIWLFVRLLTLLPES